MTFMGKANSFFAVSSASMTRKINIISFAIDFFRFAVIFSGSWIKSEVEKIRKLMNE